MGELHVIFTHRDVRYALPAEYVCEIAWLPELAAIVDGSPWVIGAFNQRGHVVPVVDLALCFGHPRSALRSADAVIVLAFGGERFGLLAHSVDDAVPIAADMIEAGDADHELLGHATSLVCGLVLLGQDLAMLLDVRAMLTAAADARESRQMHEGAAIERGFAEAELLHERARCMALPEAPSKGAAAEFFALVSLNGEPFGVPVPAVREFTTMGRLWPVPCCPSHVLGSVNVRGDIVTVVDLRPVLGLPAAQAPAELVVMRVGTLYFGLAVTAVRDVVSAVRLASLPVADARRESPFCRGTARADDVVFSIIDIDSMLAARVLHVSQGTSRHSPGSASTDIQAEEAR